MSLNPDIGIYHDLAHLVASSIEPSLSYLSRDWPEVDAWRSLARGKVLELLAFTPPGEPLNPAVESTASHEGKPRERRNPHAQIRVGLSDPA